MKKKIDLAKVSAYQLIVSLVNHGHTIEAYQCDPLIMGRDERTLSLGCAITPNEMVNEPNRFYKTTSNYMWAIKDYNRPYRILVANVTSCWENGKGWESTVHSLNQYVNIDRKTVYDIVPYISDICIAHLNLCEDIPITGGKIPVKTRAKNGPSSVHEYEEPIRCKLPFVTSNHHGHKEADFVMCSHTNPDGTPSIVVSNGHAYCVRCGTYKGKASKETPEEHIKRIGNEDACLEGFEYYKKHCEGRKRMLMDKKKFSEPVPIQSASFNPAGQNNLICIANEIREFCTHEWIERTESGDLKRKSAMKIIKLENGKELDYCPICGAMKPVLIE